MSDYSQGQVARLVGLQGTVIIAGTAATLMTSAFKCKSGAPLHVWWCCATSVRVVKGWGQHCNEAQLTHNIVELIDSICDKKCLLQFMKWHVQGL